MSIASVIGTSLVLRSDKICCGSLSSITERSATSMISSAFFSLSSCFVKMEIGIVTVRTCGFDSSGGCAIAWSAARRKMEQSAAAFNTKGLSIDDGQFRPVDLYIICNDTFKERFFEQDFPSR